MSLRVVLGAGLALALTCPTCTAVAEPKTPSITSDRHSSPSRSARNEAADDERPRKGRAQKEDSDEKESTRKGRAQKDDSDEKASARKARAQKEDSDEKESARKGRAQKDDSDEKASARKARAQKEDADEKASARKGRAQKDDSDEKASARKARAQKEDADEKASARKARAQKEDSDEKASARKARARKEDSDDEESVGKGRAQKQPEARHPAEPSSDSDTLAALKQQLRDLRKQVADTERLRAELAAVKAQVRGSARAASDQSSDNETLATLKQQLRDLQSQVGDTERLRVELAAAKAQVRGSAPKLAIWGGMPLTLPPSLSARPGASPEIDVLAMGFPDVRAADPRPPQPPVNPATASLPAVIRERPQAERPPKSAVEEAKTYLVKTATPGYTMTRQGISLAIDRLHPGFAVKLAEAVKRARDEGLTEAGVFSAYRPPAFGIGGFRDKFQSFHSYGLATDMTGIGGPGSDAAHHWHRIVVDVGLYLPYGPDHRVEYNHTQFVPEKIAPSELRATITADGPIDLRQMWLASGVDAFVTEPPAVAAAAGAVSGEEPRADAPKPDALKADAAKLDAAKPDVAKPDVTKPDVPIQPE
jgi:hypothetical protein